MIEIAVEHLWNWKALASSTWIMAYYGTLWQYPKIHSTTSRGFQNRSRRVRTTLNDLNTFCIMSGSPVRTLVAERLGQLCLNLGVSENVVYPCVPNGFADHYPYEKWLFHWEY